MVHTRVTRRRTFSISVSPVTHTQTRSRREVNCRLNPVTSISRNISLTPVSLFFLCASSGVAVNSLIPSQPERTVLAHQMSGLNPGVDCRRERLAAPVAVETAVGVRFIPDADATTPLAEPLPPPPPPPPLPLPL